jgi:S-adenosylmethionine decarboxylase
MYYTPGLHLLAEMQSAVSETLTEMEGWKAFIQEQIAYHELKTVGEIFHQFDNGAFTATICLTESHIAIHTWPEYNRLTIDIFLSNYMKSNDAIVRAIMEANLAYFDAFDHRLTELFR